jgi:hypothetical protein
MRARQRLAVMATLGLGLLLVAAGCGQAARAEAPAGSLGWAHAVLRFQPDPPVARRWTTMTVRLDGAGGAPVSGAHLQVDFSMVGMVMPPQSATLRPAGAGVYTARVLLVMGGAWLAHLHVTAPHHASGRVNLPFQVQD